jgi:multiple sugar transport system substrate-binding protein
MPPHPPPRLTRRRFAGTALGTAAGAGAIAGCSSGGSGKDMKTLQVWGGIPAESGPQAIIDRFQEKHPDIPVKYTRYVNDDRGNLKVNTALQGDVDIDVFFTYGIQNLAMRSGEQLAADLGDRVRETPELSDFLDTEDPKALIDGDRVAAIATTRIPNMILFNDTLREKAGVDLPTEWTDEEYLEVLQQLTGDEHHGTYTLPDFPRVELGPNYRFDDQGDSNFLHPSFLEHFERSAELIRSGVLYPWSQALARHVEAYQQNNFIAEDFVSWVTAPFSLRFLADQEEYPHDFTVSAAPMPTVGDKDWNTGEYGAFVQVNAKSPKQDWAWEFSRFWLLEGARDMVKAGYMSIISDIDEDEQLLGILGEDPEKYFDVDSFRHALFGRRPRLHMDTDLTAYAEITLKYEQQRDVCWLLERSPRRAIDTVDSNTQALIDRFQEG